MKNAFSGQMQATIMRTFYTLKITEQKINRLAKWSTYHLRIYWFTCEMGLDWVVDWWILL